MGSRKTATVLVTLFLVTSCVTEKEPDIIIGPIYKPVNYYAVDKSRWGKIQRVLMLPMTTSLDRKNDQFAKQSLQPEIRAVMTSSGKFEVIWVDEPLLAQWTGKGSWVSEDNLPRDFFKIIGEKTGADAVFFSHLTVYRPYHTLAIGWRLKLVSCEDGTILWAADEVIDAGVPAMANAAREYYKESVVPAAPIADSRTILRSPRLFGRFAFHILIDTIPSY